MEAEELGNLLLDRPLVVENGHLVTHDCAHVSPECIYVLDDGGLVLLGLISIRIKSGGEVLYLVL